MARRVTQEQVSAAADELLRAGERPTIERVRAMLRTGSPPLIRLLDVWWTALGQRLAAQDRRPALPEAPEAVAQAAGALWTVALEQAVGMGAAQFAGDREALALERRQLEQDCEEARADRERALEAVAAADATRAAALARTADLGRLIGHQANQINDLQRQRDAQLTDDQALRERMRRLVEQVDNLHRTAETERTQRDALMRATEYRWLQDVDRARQETTQLQAVLQRGDTEARRTVVETDQLRAALGQSARAHAAVAARLQSANTELERLHQLLLATRGATDSKPVLKATSVGNQRGCGRPASQSACAMWHS